jgi:ribosomal protein L11 methyltransferase
MADARPEGYTPFVIGARLRVVPPGATPSADGRVDLVVARGAFGSGEHETTASCLELIESLAAVRDADVLDLGAGTGILAIAALRLGARRAVLIDIDPGAQPIAQRHCALNEVTERAAILCGELDAARAVAPPEGFGLLISNLHGDLLLRLAPGLVELARPGAHLVLSGILWEHNWDVRQRFAQLGCALLLNRFLDEYSSLLLRAH